jgi:outer membrane protein OmpA-like peptidoglycan-associated protein
MNELLLGVSLLALLAPAAYAQQASEPATTALSGQIEPGKYRVFFNFNQATLTPARVVGEAPEKYKRTGAARIAVTGHTDLSGSPAYNQALSERRAEAVQGELVWLVVPASVIGKSHLADLQSRTEYLVTPARFPLNSESSTPSIASTTRLAAGR